MKQNNYNPNWKKLLGFRNLQEKLENIFITFISKAIKIVKINWDLETCRKSLKRKVDTKLFRLGSKKSSHCAQLRRPLSYPNFLNKSHKKKRFGSSHHKSAMNALLCTTEHTRLLS